MPPNNLKSLLLRAMWYYTNVQYQWCADLFDRVGCERYGAKCQWGPLLFRWRLIHALNLDHSSYGHSGCCYGYIHVDTWLTFNLHSNPFCSGIFETSAWALASAWALSSFCSFWFSQNSILLKKSNTNLLKFLFLSIILFSLFFCLTWPNTKAIFFDLSFSTTQSTYYKKERKKGVFLFPLYANIFSGCEPNCQHIFLFFVMLVLPTLSLSLSLCFPSRNYILNRQRSFQHSP